MNVLDRFFNARAKAKAREYFASREADFDDLQTSPARPMRTVVIRTDRDQDAEQDDRDFRQWLETGVPVIRPPKKMETRQMPEGNELPFYTTPSFGDFRLETEYEEVVRQAQLSQTVRYAVAPRCKVTSPSLGLLTEGKEVTPQDFLANGFETIRRLVERGAVLEVDADTLRARTAVPGTHSHRVVKSVSTPRRGILTPGEFCSARDFAVDAISEQEAAPGSVSANGLVRPARGHVRARPASDGTAELRYFEERGCVEPIQSTSANAKRKAS